MIWRLAHPIRGIVVFLATFILLSIIIGFGVGYLEIMILIALPAGAFFVAATRGQRT